MSLRSMLWAMNEAPVDNPTEAMVLVALADNAREDGTGACPGIKKIAARARISERTAQRTLRELNLRGVIRLGDQSIAAYLGRYAPTVYDLAMEQQRADLADDVDLYDGGPGLREVVDNQGCQSDTRQSVTPARGDKRGGSGVTLVSPKPSTKPTTSTAGVVDTAEVVGAPVDNPPEIPDGYDEHGPLTPRCAEHQWAAGDLPCRLCRDRRELFERAQSQRAAAAARQRTRDHLDAQIRAGESRTVDSRAAAAAARAALRGDEPPAMGLQA